MILWRWLRQSGRIEALESAMQEQVRSVRYTEDVRAQLQSDLDRERTLRISAEVLSVERRAEVERLVAELAAVRESLGRITEDRMKSLDALNVKLMADRVEEKPPDMSQYRKMEELGKKAVSSIRDIHRQMDIAVITKLHPAFQKAAGAVMNEVVKGDLDGQDNVAAV